MANTKVTGDLIASGTITAANLVSGTLDGVLNTYLTTNSYATESYVTTAVSNLIDAAPASLDTLNELAAALNDDANFATTVTDSIATKLPLAGGTISGNLTVSGAASTGVLTAAASAGGTSAIFKNIGPQNSNGVELRGGTTGSTVNWAIKKDETVAQALQIFPSTANGGTTYTTPVATLLSSGNVGIGTSSPGSKLEVNGNIFTTSNTNYLLFGTEPAVNPYIQGVSDNSLAIGTGNVSRIFISSSGNVGIGVVPRTSGVKTLEMPNWVFEDNGNFGLKVNAYYNGSNNVYINTDEAARLFTDNGSFIFQTAPSGTAGTTVSFTETMRITSAGNVGIGTSSPVDILSLVFGGLNSGTVGISFGQTVEIPELTTRGTFLILVRGNAAAMPLAIFSAVKNDPTGSASISTIQSVAGTSFYSGKTWSLVWNNDSKPAITHNYGGGMNAQYIILGIKI